MPAKETKPAPHLVSGAASLYNESQRRRAFTTPFWTLIGAPFHPIMASAFAFTRRRFFALASIAPAILFLTRCAPLHRRDGYDDDTYTGPFFSDGSQFVE